MHHFVEGDGPIIFVCYDKIQALFNFIDSPQRVNVDAVIAGLVEDKPNPAQEAQRLKAHALGVVQPGWDYFRSKFTGPVAHQMNLLRLARFCNHIRVIEIKPTIDDLNELQLFKCFGPPLHSFLFKV